MTMLQALYTLWKSKKGDLPGWTYIIALILGLFVLIFAIWIAAKAGQKQTGILGGI